MLATALPDSKGDGVGLALVEADVHVNVADILGQRSAGPSDGDEARLDADLDALRDVQLFCLQHVAHLRK